MDVKLLFLSKNASIRDALIQISIGLRGAVVIVDDDKKMIGILTDGDIRRALLKGYSIEDEVTEIFQRKPVYGTVGMSKDQLEEILIKNAVKDIPIVNDENIVVDFIGIRDILIPSGKDNKVIIMAGGLGSRLKNLTEEIPKPMLKVGDAPILQHIIHNFKERGYFEFLISVNHKAEIIENYFQDGVIHGVRIEYLRENKRLGTGGGIGLAKDHITEPFFVINGDVLTNLNVSDMMEFHQKNEFAITIGIRKQSYQIPYGVVDIDTNEVKQIQEKPSVDYMINGGVYCLNPEVIDFIPNDEYFEITELINLLLENNLKVGAYLIEDYWMDIGQMNDYYKANDDYDIYFNSES